MSQIEGTGQHHIQCATCNNYSKFYCNTCHQRMCEQCRDVHLREKENRTHEVVLYRDRLKELPTEKCPNHPTKVLELFCVYCFSCICSKCFATDHNGHHVLDLEAIYNESLQECQKRLIKIRDTILPGCEEKLKSHRKGIENGKNKIAKLRLSMKQSADEIKAVVDTILAKNNDKLDVMEASILDEMSKQERKSEDYISYLNTMVEDYERDIMSACKPTEVIALNKEKTSIVLKKFPEIIEPEIPSFTKGEIIKEELEKFFGCINAGAEGKILKETPKSIGKSPQSFSIPTQLPSIELSSSIIRLRQVHISGLNAVIHLSPAPSGRFWASDYENLIQFNMQGNILQKISMRGHEDGFHTVTKEEDLLYTDHDKKAICRVSSDMTTTALLDTGEWRPWSIFSSHKNGDLLVGMTRDRTWKIARYSRRGIKLQDIQKDDTGNDLFSSVSYITENINGDICTTDNSKVVVVTATGEHRFSFSTNTFYSQAYGICTDVLGNIFVCTGYRGNQFIHTMRVVTDLYPSKIGIFLLNQDGQLLSRLFTHLDIYSNPRALCVYQHNLMIGEAFSPTVNIYRLSYLQNKGTT